MPTSMMDQNFGLFLLVAIWEMIWKGFALWKASQRSEKGWFIAILCINSAGIFSILYLLFFSERTKKQSKEVIKR
ncbi:MAG: DUF5652 family protein [bacterium]